MGPSKIVINEASRQVTVDGRPVLLTLSEFELLLALARSPGIARSYPDLLAAVPGARSDGDRASLQIHMSRLRAKLGDSGRGAALIRTVRGYGYLLDPDGTEIIDGGAASRPVSPTALLVYDHSLTLVSIVPRVTILGWDPCDILGTDFTFTGTARDEHLALIEAARAAALMELDNIAPLRHADGSTHLRRVQTLLHYSPGGAFEGLNGTLHLDPGDLS